MDPTSHPVPSFELPSTAAPKGEAPASAPESSPIQEGAPVAQAGSTSLAPPSMQPIDPAMYAIPGQAPLPVAGAPAATPAIADDLDLIEKEWVDKAKTIVAQTRNDPHSQNNQMNRFKADYMKKRYNKDIKLPEGS